MQKISNLVSIDMIKENTDVSQDDFADKTAHFVNYIFKVISAACPAWRQSYATQEDFDLTKNIWIRALMMSSIKNQEQIQCGLDRLLQSGKIFAISVGEFIELCKPKPEQFGLPDLDDAYAIALFNSSRYNLQKKPWVHHAVRKAAHLCGSYELSNKPEKDTKRLFKHHYDLLVKKISEGADQTLLFGDYIEQDKIEMLEYQNKVKSESKKQYFENSHEYKKWVAYKTGEKDSDPPLNGWVNTVAQEHQHQMLLEQYKKSMEERGINIPDCSHVVTADEGFRILSDLAGKWDKKQALVQK